jgi:vacuolar-type H+-ATPase subunit H
LTLQHSLPLAFQSLLHINLSKHHFIKLLLKALNMVASWENIINERAALANFCLATENFASYYAVAAQQYSVTINSDGLDPEVVKDVNKINTDNVTAGEVDYNEFSEAVESLKTQKPDKTTWEKTIDDAADRAKAKCSKLIDDAAATAKTYIEKLPESARKPAADLFNRGLNAVVDFFVKVWDGIKAVVNAVVEFLKGVWDKLKSAWNSVKDAASAAWKFITGGSYSAVYAAQSIILPASTSITEVYDEIKSQLDNMQSSNYYGSGMTINKEGRGWAISIR